MGCEMQRHEGIWPSLPRHSCELLNSSMRSMQLATTTALKQQFCIEEAQVRNCIQWVGPMIGSVKSESCTICKPLLEVHDDRGAQRKNACSGCINRPILMVKYATTWWICIQKHVIGLHHIPVGELFTDFVHDFLKPPVTWLPIRVLLETLSIRRTWKLPDLGPHCMKDTIYWETNAV